MLKSGMERVSCTDSTSEIDREIKHRLKKKKQKNDVMLSGNITQLLFYILYVLNFQATCNKCEVLY